MDIQGYVIDHWLGKMSAEKPVTFPDFSRHFFTL